MCLCSHPRQQKAGNPLGTLCPGFCLKFSFPWVVHYLLHLICMSEVIRFPREAVEPGALCLLPARTPQEVGSHYSLPYPLTSQSPQPLSLPRASGSACLCQCGAPSLLSCLDSLTAQSHSHSSEVPLALSTIQPAAPRLCHHGSAVIVDMMPGDT